MKQKKRRWQRLLSKLKRTFWTSCPRCYHRFGGHEKFHHHVAGISKAGVRTNYRIICDPCFVEIRKELLQITEGKE